MGAVGAAFGRNMPPVYRRGPVRRAEPGGGQPASCSTASTSCPARTLNVLAAAWIQFQVHDWVDHARHPLGATTTSGADAAGHDVGEHARRAAEPEMRIAGNMPSPDGDRTRAPLFANSASHWWDGSEVYGTDARAGDGAARGRQAPADAEGYLPEDTSGQEMTGFNESWWLGLSGLHTLFAREHNLLCDELRAHYRGWERRAGLPDRAADRLGADRQDPHRRVDAGDPRHRGRSTSG